MQSNLLVEMHSVQSPYRIVGILGGMGPAATVDFYDKLIKATPATRDQDHLPVVIWADPTVPNRHEALLEGGEDPTPWLERGIEHLIYCGAEIIVVPCNTIHAYLPPIMRGRGVEFISIIDTTIDAAMLVVSEGRVGLLATDGALAADVYQSALQREGIDLLLPRPDSQKKLMETIQRVKAGELSENLETEIVSILREMCVDGISTVIAGCTEVSVLLARVNVPMNILDPSDLLAFKTIERARGM